MNMNVKQRVSSNRLRIRIALECYFEDHGKEVWEINWMSRAVQTALLNTFPPEMIATVLKALRGRLTENDQVNAVEERQH